MSKSDDTLPSSEGWDATTERREWAAAVDADRCSRIAKRRNKRLVEVIDTGRPVLRFICILEDLPDD